MLCTWPSPESGPGETWALAGLGWPQIKVESPASELHLHPALCQVPRCGRRSSSFMSGYSVHEPVQMFPVCPPSHASSQLRPPSPFLASFPFHIFVVPLGPEFLFPDRMFNPPPPKMAMVLGVLPPPLPRRG